MNFTIAVINEVFLVIETQIIKFKGIFGSLNPVSFTPIVLLLSKRIIFYVTGKLSGQFDDHFRTITSTYSIPR